MSFFFSSRRRHTRYWRDWSSDVCSSDLICARTAVIEETFGIAARVSAIVLWIVTLAGAGWAVPRICSTNNPGHTGYLSQVVVRIGTTGRSAYFRVGGFTLDLHS